MTVIRIDYLKRIKDCEERREEAYAQDELNIQANAPSPLLPQSSVQKGGAYFQTQKNFEVDLTKKCYLSCSLDSSMSRWWPTSFYHGFAMV